MAPVKIDESNNKIFVSVNGRESDEITLDNGSYGPEELSKMLQKKLVEDKALSKLNVIVNASNGQVTIHSNLTGSRSVVSVRPKNTIPGQPHFLSGGVGRSGTDVEGNINGVAMVGSGQILSGQKDTDYDGLKLFVNLSDTQVGDGVEGKLIFTKGVGTKVQEYINNVLQPESGAIGIYTKNVEDQYKGYEAEVKNLEARVDVKKQKLIEKFARLESKMGQLKSEQNYVTKELAKL